MNRACLVWESEQETGCHVKKPGLTESLKARPLYLKAV